MLKYTLALLLVTVSAITAFGAAITAYPQLTTPSDSGYTIWYDPAQPVGQRDRTVTLNTFKGAVRGTTEEVSTDLTIPVTAGVVFVSTVATDETRTLTLPTFADVALNKQIEIVHTSGSSGLVIITAGDGLDQI